MGPGGGGGEGIMDIPHTEGILIFKILKDFSFVPRSQKMIFFIIFLYSLCVIMYTNKTAFFFWKKKPFRTKENQNTFHRKRLTKKCLSNILTNL